MLALRRSNPAILLTVTAQLTAVHAARIGLLLTLVCMVALAAPTQAQSPVSWWKADGNAFDSVGGNNGALQGDVGYASGFSGQAFSFGGNNGVVHIPDADNLKFTRSFTITARVNVKAYSSFVGPIFFRGDDRNELDPYAIYVYANGTVRFIIYNAADSYAYTESDRVIPLNQWTLVTASLDDATGTMSLYFNSDLVGQYSTSVRPFADLDPAQNPGVAIGNTSNVNADNFPFHGLIDEVKVYNTAVSPPHQWTAVGIAAGTGSAINLLWDNTGGAASSWNLNGNTVVYSPTYGPYAGWTARAIAAAPNGSHRLLWTNTNGTASVWTVATNGSITYSPTYGPFAGWSAVGVTVGPDGLTHLLWTNTNGSASYWNFAANGTVTYSPTFGPFTGWTAHSLSAGGDNGTRLLWTNTDGRAGLWTIAPSGSIDYGTTYGPFATWTAIAVGVGTDNAAHLLWDNSDGRISYWNIATNGGVTYSPTYGPY